MVHTSACCLIGVDQTGERLGLAGSVSFENRYDIAVGGQLRWTQAKGRRRPSHLSRHAYHHGAEHGQGGIGHHHLKVSQALMQHLQAAATGADLSAPQGVSCTAATKRGEGRTRGSGNIKNSVQVRLLSRLLEQTTHSPAGAGKSAPQRGTRGSSRQLRGPSRLAAS